MSGDILAAANVNSFASPSDQLITLTYGQLQDLIMAAVEPLRDEIRSLHERLDGIDNWTEKHAEAFAYVAQKVKSLEAPPTPNQKTKGHIDELHRLMLEEKTSQVSILKASRLLKISKERMRQLKPEVLADGRFDLVWDHPKGQKKRVVIKIRKFIP